MVDLQGQYQQIKETVNTSIEQVLNSSTYINGPLVHEFQSDLEKYFELRLFALQESPDSFMIEYQQEKEGGPEYFREIMAAQNPDNLLFGFYMECGVGAAWAAAWECQRFLQIYTAQIRNSDS